MIRFGHLTFCNNQALTIVGSIMLLACGEIYSQPFGNEWIDFNQSYYEIRLAEDGIYRINQSALNGAGVPISSIDPRRFQIFHRGTEQAIFVEGQQDGSFDATDYIEFYGKRNDGVNETELYLAPEAQPHTRYSLFNDSSSYYLTWRLSPQNGKRMSSFFENNVDGIPEEDYHLDENLILNTNNYSAGRTYSGGNVLLSQFDFGEGWTGSDISRGNTADFTLTNLNNTHTTGPNPNITIILTGRNNLSHNVDLFVGPNTGSLRNIGNVQFNAHDNFVFQSEIEWSDIDLGLGQMVVRVSVLGVGENADRAAVSLIDLDYPQVPDMNAVNSKVFTLREEPTNKSYLEVIDSPGNIRLYDITDPDNLISIGVNQTPTLFNAVIPSTAITRTLIAVNNASTSFEITPVIFDDVDPSDYDYHIIAHPDLMTTTSSGQTDPVQAYKEFRESQEGGAYSVLVSNILTLYDQYNFGETSPLAIRRFADFMIQNGSPQILLLLGEGLDVPKNPDRTTKASLEASGQAHLIPTFGFPGSDIALIADLDGTTVSAPIPIGRVTARTPDDVQNYLDKVTEYEMFAFDDLYRKRLLHLSGGTTPQELEIFRGNVEGFEAVAVADFLGGSVSTVSKQSSNPIELFNVSEAVNNGLGMITFFGHSGPNGSDLDIGQASNPSFGYNNSGLYNTIIVNGCNAGDVFGTTPSFGEDWILTPNAGSVAFMAHSDNGLSTQLRRFTDQVYEVGYGDSLFISQSLGSVKQEASRRYLDQFGTGEIQIAQVQQFILQGDPAISLFGADQVDYDVTSNDIFISSFDGETVTALTDSFEVNIIVRNFGITSSQPFSATVNRFLSDGSVQSFDATSLNPISFEDTISITVRSVASQNSFGNNKFEVILDPDNEIDEISEINNTASTDFFISSGTAVNLFPKNFGIETASPVRFLSQTSDVLSNTRGFIFELDTTKDFNSPLLIRRTGDFKVLAEWNIDLPITNVDTMVYYWRTKFSVVMENEEDRFAESSFTYIPGSSDGWAQSAFDQFDLLENVGLLKDETINQWGFIETQVPANVQTHGINHFSGTQVLYDSLSLLLDGSQILLSGTNPNFICRSNSINAVAFDQASLANYLVFGVNTAGDPQRCGRNPFIINNILNSEIQGTGLKLNSYIDGVVDGDFILLFSIGELTYESWPTEVFDQLRTIGVSSAFLGGLQDGQPLIIIGKKGSAEGTATELSGLDTQNISLNEVITGNFTTGSLKTPRIGPASTWEGFFQENRFLSGVPATATSSFDIITVDREGNESTLFGNLTSTTQDLSGIDAEQFPFIKLRFSTTDETNLTPIQIEKWQVNFQGVPEGILLTDDPLVSRESVVERSEGEPLETAYYFKNISRLSFPDSIPVNLSLFNSQSRETFADATLLKPLAPDDSATFTYPVSTFGKTGLNDINVFVNPNEESEVSINNNIIDINNFLQVDADETNPILDVTFDGVYILDGDIVSPSPNILIRLKDENQFILKQDTTGVEVALREPCEGCDFERVNFSSPNIQLTPADQDTDFQIEYNPRDLADGVYGLQVQAVDGSGNSSGSQPYEITFEVINESTITHFYPYPNPFSTSTRFVFTLTGSEIPDQIKIQIMTVSGKIVREITQDELGPIRIGNNLTDFAWDGHDEFGDQLANGVYLYRVMLRINGEKIERMNTFGDKAFKNGFGKLYLLR